MKQFFLAEIVTKDKLVHQGIFFQPQKTGKLAILWVHGLTDNFYGDLPTLEAFSEVCEKEGWGLASFNTRGHDIISSVKKLDPTNPKGQTSLTLGSSYENFTNCIYDIDAGISFLVKQGFPQVVLVGISTGANKVCYYAGKKPDLRVVGVVLASPISDVAIKKRELGNRFSNTLRKVETLIKKGKGEALVEGLDFMPLTPKRFLSLARPNGAEDTFPYYQKNPHFATLAKIKKPLLVVLAGADEYSDRPAKDILRVFAKYQRSKAFHGVVIPNAFHSFGGKEKEFVREITGWIKNNINVLTC